MKNTSKRNVGAENDRKLRIFLTFFNFTLAIVHVDLRRIGTKITVHSIVCLYPPVHNSASYSRSSKTNKETPDNTSNPSIFFFEFFLKKDESGEWQHLSCPNDGGNGNESVAKTNDLMNSRMALQG